MTGTNKNVKNQWEIVALDEFFSRCQDVDVTFSDYGKSEILKIFKGELGVFEFNHFGVWITQQCLHGSGNISHNHGNMVRVYNSILADRFSENIETIKAIVSKASGFNPLDPISFFNAREVTQLELRDETDILTKDGRFKTEKILEDVLYDNFIWAAGLNVARQVAINGTKCDLAVTHNKDLYAIELKKDAIKNKDLLQTYNYSLNDSGYIPILIGSEIDTATIKTANELGIVCYSYEAYRTGAQYDESVFLTLESDGDHSEKFDDILKDRDAHNFLDVDYKELFADVAKMSSLLDDSVKRKANFIKYLEIAVTIKDDQVLDEESCQCCGQVLPDS